jgi:hypothetical protein
VVPGNYFVILRTDVFNNVPETDESNNCCGFSIGQVQVSALPLALSEPDDPMPFEGTLQQGEEKYFELVTPSDQTVRIFLDHSSPIAWTELYVKFGSPPTAGDFDFQFNNPGLPDQEVFIPNSLAGTYYVLTKATNGTFEPNGIEISLLAESLPLSLSAAVPDAVGAGPVTIALEGSQLGGVESVRLQARERSIEAEYFSVESETLILAHFNCTDAPFGDYELVVSAGRESAALSPIFIGAASQPTVRVETLLQGPFRAGTDGSGVVIVSNEGNVDARTVQIIGGLALPEGGCLLSVAAPSSEIEGVNDPDSSSAGFTAAFRDLRPGESRTISLGIFPGDVAGPVRGGARAIIASDDVLDSIGDRTRQFVVDYPDGIIEEFREETLAAAVSETEWDLYWLNFTIQEGLVGQASESWFMPTVFQVACEGGRTAASDDEGSFDPCDCESFCEEFWVCQKIFKKGIGKFVKRVSPAAEFIPELVCDYVVCPAVESLVCAAALFVSCDDDEALQSMDPNEKVGPAGFGEQRWIRSSGAILYRVYFENLPEATAAAARVEIRDVLDSSLNPASLRIGDIVVGDYLVDVPDNQINFSGVIDLVEERGVLVRIVAGVNAAAAPPEAFWVFQAIDPQTGEPPVDGAAGFLPPEDGSGSGQGYVEFSIKLDVDLPTGEVVNNSASIVFDNNEPIITNTVFNTVDADRPSSAMDGLPPVVEGPEILLSFSGFDPPGGSGLSGVSVLVSVDGSPPVPFVFSRLTEAVYDGEAGRVYGFTSRAEDHAGNLEDVRVEPDAITAIPNVGLAAESDSGVFGDDITNDMTPTILIVSAPMSDVALEITGGDIRINGSVPTGANGRGTFVVPEVDSLPDGTYLLTANSYGVAVSREIRIDTAVPTIESWASVLVHGDAGESLIPVLSDGSSSESRQPGISSLLLSFTAKEQDIDDLLPESVSIVGRDADGQPVDLSDVVSTVSVRDKQPIHEVIFTPPLPNGGTYCVTLVGVSDAAGNPLDPASASRVITGLVGDATGDRRVNNTDVGGVLSLVGTDPIDPRNPLHVVSDLDVDGDVDDADVQIALGARGADMRFAGSPCGGMLLGSLNRSEPGPGEAAVSERSPTSVANRRQHAGTAATQNRSDGDRLEGEDIDGEREPSIAEDEPLLETGVGLLPVDFTRIGVFDPTGRIDVPKVIMDRGFDPEALSAMPISGWWMLQVAGQDATRGGQRAVVDELTSNGLFATPVLEGEGGAAVFVSTRLLVAFEQEEEPEVVSRTLLSADAGMTISEQEFAGVPGLVAVETSYRSGFDVLEAIETLGRFPEVRFAESDAIFTGFHSVVGAPRDSRFGAPGNEGAGVAADGSRGLVVLIGDGVLGTLEDGVDVTTDRGRKGAPISAFDVNGTVAAGSVQLASGGTARIASARTMITSDDRRTWFSQVSWTLRALAWAEEIGADITANPSRYGLASRAIEAKYGETARRGMLHFGMAGDDSNLLEPAFPARLGAVEAVGAVDSSGRAAAFSARGPAFVGLGHQVLVPDRPGEEGFGPGDWVYMSGTGVASAQVAGIAAALAGHDGAAGGDILEALRLRCEDLGEPGFDPIYGWGMPLAVGGSHGNGRKVSADIDADGEVTMADLVLALNAFGGVDTRADIDGSGLVDERDLVLVIEGLVEAAVGPGRD